MPSFSGTFFGTVMMQTALGVPDTPLHALVMAQISGKQKSADPNWDGAKLTYWGMGDLLSGVGKQSGYFLNEHPNGDTTFGNFEGDITVGGERNAMETRIDGTWNLKSGTGHFQRIIGGGKFTARSTNPITVEMEWSGEYTLPS